MAKIIQKYINYFIDITALKKIICCFLLKGEKKEKRHNINKIVLSFSMAKGKWRVSTK